MSGRVLYESGLVAKTVTAVLAHAVEMRLVFPVTAVRIMAVLVEPEPQVPFGHRFVLEYAHRVLDPGLAHLRAHVPRRRRGPVVEVLLVMVVRRRRRRRRRRGRRVVAGRGRLGRTVLQQPVGQLHGLMVVETGRRREHET